MPRRSCIAGLVCFSLLGQIPQIPTFQTQSNLVIVNVSVRDKSGQLIENLKKEDFTVLEDDRPQNVSVFEIEHLNSNALQPLVPPTNQLQRRSAPAPSNSAAAAPAADPAVSRRDRRLLALYFDFSAMQPPEQFRANKPRSNF